MRKKRGKSPTPAHSLPVPADGMDRVCFDLDGTLAKGTWPSPEIGEPNPQVVEAVRDYYRMGYEIVVYTSRPKSHEYKVWDFLYLCDLDEMVYDVVCDKPRAGLYWDDRAYNPVGVEVKV